jgi:hypothetical protein
LQNLRQRAARLPTARKHSADGPNGRLANNAGSLVPPKPQHSSGRAGRTNSMPSTLESRSMGLVEKGSCNSDGSPCLLERFGHEVVYPRAQTCCGQPMANAGFNAECADTEALRLPLLAGRRDAAPLFEQHDHRRLHRLRQAFLRPREMMARRVPWGLS